MGSQGLMSRRRHFWSTRGPVRNSNRVQWGTIAMCQATQDLGSNKDMGSNKDTDSNKDTGSKAMGKKNLETRDMGNNN